MSNYSRLYQRRQKKGLHQALIYLFLSLVLILFLFFLGIPLLIKLAIFLGNFKNSSILNESDDILPPAPPALSSSFIATNSAVINLQGFAENGSSVEVFLNGLAEKKTLTEANGEFILGNIALEEGNNEIYAIATDKAGNPSQKSNLLNIVFDKTPPKLTVLQPQSEQIFYYPQKSLEVKGETDANSLMINDRLITIDTQGKFSLIYTLQEGENLIKLVASDMASNQTSQELKVFLK